MPRAISSIIRIFLARQVSEFMNFWRKSFKLPVGQITRHTNVTKYCYSKFGVKHLMNKLLDKNVFTSCVVLSPNFNIILYNTIMNIHV